MWTFYNLHNTWGLKAARGPSETARSAPSPPCILQHISKDKGVYWRSNMLCIRQAAPCSDSCECSSSVRLNIWQGSDLSWLSSDLIQHYPVQLTTAGLRVLKAQCGLTNYRIKAASPSLPENTHAFSSEGTTSRITLSVFSSSFCQYSKHSLVAAKKVIPNCPGEMA